MVEDGVVGVVETAVHVVVAGLDPQLGGACAQRVARHQFPGSMSEIADIGQLTQLGRLASS